MKWKKKLNHDRGKRPIDMKQGIVTCGVHAYAWDIKQRTDNALSIQWNYVRLMFQPAMSQQP